MPSMAVERPLVLYIEDDDDLWRLMQRRLSDEFSLVRAASDVEACVLLREFWVDLRVIVTDLNLGRGALSGLDLIQLVRGTLALERVPAWARKVPTSLRLPIIVTTGSEVHAAAARAAGATRVLMKPFRFAALQTPLRDVVKPPPARPEALAASAGVLGVPAEE
ncbi:MAG: response regulator [Myxococcaceae bacterium]|nr:response regulator [Myxococcaceae bacterium]